MKSLILLTFILFSAASVIHAEPVRLYGFGLENGCQYDYTISREQYDKQPIIKIGVGELPVSPAEATRIALNAIKPLLPPEQLSQLWCGGINLYQIPNPDDGKAVNSKRWYYRISLRNDLSVLFPNPSPHMLYDEVLVLMDGTPVLLKERANNTRQ